MEVTISPPAPRSSTRGVRAVLGVLAALTALGAIAMNYLDGDWLEGTLFMAAAAFYTVLVIRAPRLSKKLTVGGLVVLGAHFAWNCFNVFVDGEVFSVVFLALIAASAALLRETGQR